MTTDLRTLARTLESIGDELFGIVWADGHESVYPLAHLRDACPCASCNQKRGAAPAASGSSPGGFALPVVGSPGSGAPPGLARWEAVGRYAVRFFWSDRHDTGIYTFEYLRAICACEACDAERARGGATARAAPGGP